MSRRRKPRVVAVLSLVVLATSLLAGCGSEQRQLEGNRYADDGYLGMSNTNPNMRMNATHHNYNKDRQLMRQALREMDLDKQSTIFMNGTQVTVTIHMDEDLDPSEAAAIRSDAYLLLKGNVPRYDYSIRFD